MAISSKQSPPVCLCWHDALVCSHCRRIPGALHDQGADGLGPVTRIPRLQVCADSGNLGRRRTRIAGFSQEGPRGLVRRGDYSQVFRTNRSVFPVPGGPTRSSFRLGSRPWPLNFS
jgi:hypothetical protein